MPLSPDSPLPSHYQLANLNWYPTVDMKVQSYALEQENLSSLNQALSTVDS